MLLEDKKLFFRCDVYMHLYVQECMRACVHVIRVHIYLLSCLLKVLLGPAIFIYIYASISI